MALDLGGLLRAIGRALVWLLPLTLFVAVAVFLGLQFVAPKYQAEARILIESTDNRFPGASRGAEEERAILDSEGVASQVQLLMSTDLARRIAQELDLAAIPEFEAKGSASLVGDLLTSIGLGKPSAGNSEEERVLSHFFTRTCRSTVLKVPVSSQSTTPRKILFSQPRWPMRSWTSIWRSSAAQSDKPRNLPRRPWSRGLPSCARKYRPPARPSPISAPVPTS
ncbi:Wzz/FepE/Etk N-terminal domain-containing protein [Roseibium salinum]|nr:Wzz/FepE/Etk N-terminal domain-containing protein [Roseibium salinum]